MAKQVKKKAKKKRRHTAKPKPAGMEKLCGAKKTRGTGSCSRPAGWGTKHAGRGRCKWHGGNTPSHVAAAHREEAEEAVAVYGLPREIEPQAALLEEIHRTAGHVAWLEQRIRQLDPGELTYGTFKDAARTVGAGDAQTVERRVERRAGITALLNLYHRERKHLVDVCRVAIAAGIAERQVRLAEQQGALIAQVIRGVLEDLGVAENEEVPKIVRRHLMLVDGAA